MIDGVLLGTIIRWAGIAIPNGWALCDGRVLQIAQYQALYALIGPRFGQPNPNSFQLPDLRGLAVGGAHLGGGSAPNYGTGGAEAVALQPGAMPSHGHVLRTYAAPGNVASVVNAVPASTGTSAHIQTPPNIYKRVGAGAGALVAMDPASIQPAGSGAPHDNMQPYLALNYIIALTGLFPSQN